MTSASLLGAAGRPPARAADPGAGGRGDEGARARRRPAGDPRRRADQPRRGRVVAVAADAAVLAGSRPDASAGPLYHGVFHAVSSFNNAGFALYSDNLIGFATDPFICLPIAAAVIIGGIGFPVILELRRELGTPRTWSLHTKTTLLTTGLLLLVGSGRVTAFEWRNPATLGPLSVADKLLVGFFQGGVQPRTAGFNSLDYAQVHETSLLVTDVLMFIGGGSAGTAGGIKVTTFMLLLFAIIAEVRGDPTVDAFGRQVPAAVLRQALSVALLGVALVGVATLGAASPISGLDLDRVLFEAISAFATVGLSTGITATLPPAGQYILDRADVRRPHRADHAWPPRSPCASAANCSAYPRSERSLAKGLHEGAVLVVGLGRFGSALAEDLQRLGHEVLAVDTSIDLVQEWSDRLTHVVQVDATSEAAMRQIGAHEFDLAVVAIGTGIEASLLSTGVLVDLGIREIWAKAITAAARPAPGAHRRQPRRLPRTRHRPAGRPPAQRPPHGLHRVRRRLHHRQDARARGQAWGRTLAESALRTRYGVTVVGVKRPGEDFTHALPETRVQEGDLLIVSGPSAVVEKFAVDSDA